MVKTDLRWLRTERNIKAAFESAIQESALEKITVTSLASAAEINKATFYLHYRDIFHLAQEYSRHCARQVVSEMDYIPSFFEDTSLFIHSFINDLTARSKTELKPLKDNDVMHLFIDEFLIEFKKQLNQIAPVPEDSRDDIALSFILGGLFTTTFRYRESDLDDIVLVCGGILDTLNDRGKEKHQEYAKDNAAAKRRKETYQSTSL